MTDHKQRAEKAEAALAKCRGLAQIAINKLRWSNSSNSVGDAVNILKEAALADTGDLQAALAEPGERTPYAKFQREIGLDDTWSFEAMSRDLAAANARAEKAERERDEAIALEVAASSRADERHAAAESAEAGQRKAEAQLRQHKADSAKIIAGLTAKCAEAEAERPDYDKWKTDYASRYTEVIDQLRQQLADKNSDATWRVNHAGDKTWQVCLDSLGGRFTVVKQGLPTKEAAEHWRDKYAEPMRQLRQQLTKAKAFKEWTHNYLDSKGVPHHPPGPHGAEGCRIGDRMDWVFAGKVPLGNNDLPPEEVTERLYEVKEQNAQLRQQLAEWHKLAEHQGGEINQLRQQLAEMTKDRDGWARNASEMAGFQAQTCLKMADLKDQLAEAKATAELYHRGYNAMQAADISEYLALCASVRSDQATAERRGRLLAGAIHRGWIDGARCNWTLYDLPNATPESIAAELAGQPEKGVNK